MYPMTQALMADGKSEDAIYITEQLARRKPKQPDHLLEKQALQELAAHMTQGPAAVLPRFVELAMKLTGADSAGLSLYDSLDEPTLFRWRHLHGVLAPFEDATTPRDDSPCGVTLDCNAPTLARHPERKYAWIRDADIVVPEVLLVPLYVGGADQLGTLWVASDREGHFDSGDVRICSELAAFVGITLRMAQSEQRLQRLLDEQEIIAGEMSHRLKNIFAVADSMIRIGARTAETPAALAAALSGRIQALSHAHALVRRKAGKFDGTAQVVALGELVEAIVDPYRRPHGEVSFTLSGPPVSCGHHTTNGIALVMQELATNAAKYGALASPSGRVRITWQKEGDQLLLVWDETGGPPISARPEGKGFGSTLLDRTITSQFRGTLQRDWRPEGLHVTMRLSLKRLAT